MDPSTGEDIFNEVALSPEYKDNSLTLKANGMYLSTGQGLFGNTVTVKYANK